MKAISVLEPWATLIVRFGKDVENRSWHSDFLGPLVICSSGRFEPGWDEDRYDLLRNYHLPKNIGETLPETWLEMESLCLTGHALGVVDKVGCVLVHPSPWADLAQWNWLLSNPRKLSNPFPVKGRLGLYDIPDETILNAL